MKKNGFILMALLPLYAVSCNKSLECDWPALTVRAEIEEVCAGEPVTFSLSGHADYISFWSGEYGSDYEHRDGREVETGWEYTMSFTSKVTKGSQKEQLSMLVSNSFDGNYLDFDDIISSDWTDVTRRFEWASSGSPVFSTAQSLVEFMDDVKPLYVAFRYRTRPQTEFGSGSNWLIGDFKISNDAGLPDNVTVYDNSNSGFRVIDPFARTNAAANASVSQTLITMGAYDAAAAPDEPETEYWVISRPLYKQAKVNMGPDRPVVIKNFTQPDLNEYTYVFEREGVYDVVFAASNQTIRDKKETLVKIRISVHE